MVIITDCNEKCLHLFIIRIISRMTMKRTAKTLILYGKFSIYSGICNENILKNSVSRLWIRSSVSVWKSSHHIVLLTPEAIPFMILFIMRYPMLNIPETADVIPRQTAL